jgi:starch phosphorylase
MSQQTHVSHPIYNLLSAEIEGLSALAELALDMRWPWNYATDEVWRQLDPELWALTHNPWVVLQTVSRDQIERLLAEPGFCQQVIFLSDSDRLLTEQLVQSVDVWLNTPRRSWEASGTSGMQVLVNGGINLSELDGWWAEAYTPEVGWALGDGQEYGDDPAWDAAEANALYDLLEQQVIPEFDTRDEQGIPVAWVRRMRESMARLTPHFSANRTVREYTEQHYRPAAAAYRARSANRGEVASRIVNWQQTRYRQWATLCFAGLI